jgi:hypothetical protein
MRKVKSWRDVLPVHPAAELFPPMAPAELKVLGADIKKNGLRVPTIWWRDPATQQLFLLDGRNRLDAIEASGGNIVVGGTPGHDVTDLRGVLLNSDYWYVLPPSGPRGVNYPDPYDYVISANILRRHLTTEQKRDLIAKLLKASPEKSNRAIGEMVKADKNKVKAVRNKLEATGEIAPVEKTVGKDGKARPATKKSIRKPEPVDAAPVTSPKKRSMAQAIREHTVGADMYVAAKTLWHKMPLPDQERFLSYLAASLEVERAIAPGGYDGTAFVLKRASEAERLQVRTRELEDEVRRCEIQIVGLKSEIDELKAARASEHPDVKGAQPADQEPAAADPFDIPPMLDRTGVAP